MPPGNYQVALKFAEIFDAAGQRLQNVSINGTQVLSTFDIAADVRGARTQPTIRFFNSISPVNGQIVIGVCITTATSPDRNAKVTALQDRPASGHPPPLPRTPTSTPVFCSTAAPNVLPGKAATATSSSRTTTTASFWA